ncbi:ArsR family transcriptional regulator [Hyphomicrobium methylovorum]|uniref:ArsR/SmtB family transcription factor n=1 Tax=Hyphomicrobium methylovorum TaxID=84 RepID=UPI0015E72A95|nr:metalloregulator ArsR/SmtB family transcription factor [Hyphomicrobium methylovorum]MBA2126068.1 ArsR family transcriptional regulator [Hyphomicrobium methylovorum]
MSSCSPKQAIFASLAEVAQALGHHHRLELLEHLGQGERSVEDLSARAKLNFANTSRHLQILRRARLVETRRNGKRVLYSLAGDVEVVSLMHALGRVGERNIAEVGRVMTDFFHARDALEPVARTELLTRLQAGLVTVLDVRPEDEFAQGHVAGALNIPIDELERRLKELPRRREIIAYCRGPYCIFSFEAVAELRTRGYLVRRLEDGYPEWKAAGLPVEVSDREPAISIRS